MIYKLFSGIEIEAKNKHKTEINKIVIDINYNIIEQKNLLTLYSL